MRYDACKIQILTAEISILCHLMGKRRALDVFPPKFGITIFWNDFS
jgi:hypothetical protein